MHTVPQYKLLERKEQKKSGKKGRREEEKEGREGGKEERKEKSLTGSRIQIKKPRSVCLQRLWS